jgi:hypothetical protein
MNKLFSNYGKTTFRIHRKPFITKKAYKKQKFNTALIYNETFPHNKKLLTNYLKRR